MHRVGDNVIVKEGAKDPFLCTVTKIVSNIHHPNEEEYSRFDVKRIMNAHTGRKSTMNRLSVSGSYVQSLEEFLDNKRVLIRAMEKYL